MVLYILAGLVLLCVIAFPIFGYSSGEKAPKEIASNAAFGLMAVFPALIVMAVISLGNMVAGDYGTTHEQSRETYQLAPNSDVNDTGRYANFIYTDGAGKPQTANKRVDYVTHTKGTGTTVEYVATVHEQGTWLFPWGNSTVSRELIVK